MEEMVRKTGSRAKLVARNQATGFTTFIREQGVVGLAVGFILGASVAKVVTSLVNDVINPLIGGLMGRTTSLKTAVWTVGSAKVMIGSFVSTLIDFTIIAAVIYFSVKILKLDRLDVRVEKPLAKVPAIEAKLGK